MRTNIDIDPALLAEAMEVSGAKTKREVVDLALQLMVTSHRRRKALEKLWGIGWEGDLDMLRDGGPKTEGAFDRRGDAAE